MAWIANARIIQVAQQSCPPVGTLAEEGSHAIVTGGAVVTSRAGTVVNVLAAVVAHPPVDAHAVVAAVRIVAGSAVLTRVWHQLTLVHVLGAVLTCVMRRALAVVGVHSIHTHSTVLAAVAWTVVNIVLTVLTCEAW